MEWSLARKVSLALVAILLCTMVSAAVFGYLKFESVLSSMVQSRYSFVVFTIKKNVEDRLNLGLALRQLRQVQEAIEREKVGDSQILGIGVYDFRGELLFDTDRGAIGSAVPEAWVASLQGSSGHPFSHLDDDSLVVGLPLVNSLGKVEGGVVLRYPEAYLEAEMGGLLGHLVLEILALFAAASLAAVAGAYALFAGVKRRLGEMGVTLGKVMAEGGSAVAEQRGDDFESRFAEFVTKTREAVDHVRDATQEVERLDRLA